MCRAHLKSEFKVDIRPSTIPNAGLGLFVSSKQHGPDEVVFKAHNTIVPYFGEAVDRQTIMERYGRFTAPYGIQNTNLHFEDGATHRGVGTLINHKPASANAYFSVFRGKASIKALRGIKNNTELFLSYGRAYRMNEPVQYSTNKKKWNV